MKSMSICRKGISAVIPPFTHLTCSPPARIRPREGVPILVPSLKRSGTHLLIDTVLNHFPPYRQRPLYIDFDRYALQHKPMDRVISCGAYVIKTHYPQQALPAEAEAALATLAERSVILQPTRDDAAVFRSLQRFEAGTTEASFAEESERFRRFWSAYPLHVIAFQEMTDPASFPAVVRNIEEITGLAAVDERYPPPDTAEIGKVLRMKLLTRLLGPRAPVVNTTIQFASGTRRTPGVSPETNE